MKKLFGLYLSLTLLVSGCSTVGSGQEVSNVKKNPQAHLELAYSYYNVGNIPVAKQEIESFLETTPKSPNGLFLLGLIYVHENQVKEAQKVFKTVLREDAGHAESLHSLGLLSCLNGEYAEAQQYFSNALRGVTKDRKWLNTIMASANCYVYSGENAKAVERYNEGILYNQNNPTVLYQLARLYHLQGFFENSNRLIEAIHTMVPKNAESLWLSALNYRAMGISREAEVLQRELQNAFPLSEEAGLAKNNQFFMPALRKLTIKQLFNINIYE